MALGDTCSEEITNCELLKLDQESLFKKLLRLTGNCLSFNVSGSVSLTAPSESAVMASAVLSSASGNIPTAGADNVLIETDQDWVGTINGVEAPANRIYSFRHGLGKPLPNIAYTRTAGTLTYRKIS